MKEIQLNSKQTTSKNYKKYIALVDDADYDWLNQFYWSLDKSLKTHYAHTNPRNPKINKGKKIRMHRLIMNAKHGQMIDHIDGNGLNNQRSNLRFCTSSQNQANRKQTNNSVSKYLGVTISYSQTYPWRARICVKGNTKYLGSFKSETEAAKARDDAAKLYHGEFVRLNLTENE